MAATPGALMCEGNATTLQRRITVLPSVTIRFAGDSGDGMQLAGTQFTDTSALLGAWRFNGDNPLMPNTLSRMPSRHVIG